MATPSLVELAESGAHYGHHRSLLYPKAKGSVFMIKNNIALINLEQTREQIEKARKVLHQVYTSDGIILFVGTRRLVRTAVKNIAESLNMPYIAERWYGGFLTNSMSFLSQIKEMNKLEDYLAGDQSKKLEKKERLLKERHLARMHRFLGGVKKMTKLPDLIVLASSGEDRIAIAESNVLGIPTIAITDTDINPDLVNIAIPANDDAPKAVELILTSIVDTSVNAPKAEDPEHGRRAGEEVKKTEKTEPTKVEKKIEKVEPKPVAKKAPVKKEVKPVKKAVTKPVAKKAVSKPVKKVEPKTAKKTDKVAKKITKK